MSRKVSTNFYFYVYDNDKDDMVWYSPSSDNEKTCNQNLLNCIEEAKRILYRNPGANVDVCMHAVDMCDGFEDGDEWDATLAKPNQLDELEAKTRKKLK